METREYLISKRIEILDKIKPICEAFNITDYDYEIDNNHERLRINDVRIGCSCNSMKAIVDELVGYIFVCKFHERWLGHFKKQTFNCIKEYWLDQ